MPWLVDECKPECQHGQAGCNCQLNQNQQARNACDHRVGLSGGWNDFRRRLACHVFRQSTRQPRRNAVHRQLRIGASCAPEPGAVWFQNAGQAALRLASGVTKVTRRVPISRSCRNCPSLLVRMVAAHSAMPATTTPILAHPVSPKA